METLDIAFVVLHYNVLNETINLINSIREKIDTAKYKVVVVDNCSPNKSGEEMAALYSEAKDVIILLNEKNVGFANGNNIGINFCREKYHVQFICCLNNDTLVIQNDFFHKIEMEYKKSKAALIGPKIILNDGSLQYTAYQLEKTSYYIAERNRFLNYHNSEGQKKGIKSRFPRLYKKYSNFMVYYFNPGLMYRRENCVLHGCCLIFTPAFFEVLEGFDQRTFLYREEELLYLMLSRNSLKSVYCPKIKIKHLEDVATNSVTQTSDEKIRWLCQNQVNSLNVLIQELEDYENR